MDSRFRFRIRSGKIKLRAKKVGVDSVRVVRVVSDQGAGSGQRHMMGQLAVDLAVPS